MTDYLYWVVDCKTSGCGNHILLYFLGPDNPSATHVLDYGQRMPAWVGKMQTVHSFGPFVNGAGGGDVPRGAQVIIRILIPREPED